MRREAVLLFLLVGGVAVGAGVMSHDVGIRILVGGALVAGAILAAAIIRTPKP